MIIPLNKHEVNDVEKHDGTIINIAWDALLPFINQLVMLRGHEQIDGLIISEGNIRVKISNKRGELKKNPKKD